MLFVVFVLVIHGLQIVFVIINMDPLSPCDFLIWMLQRINKFTSCQTRLDYRFSLHITCDSLGSVLNHRSIKGCISYMDMQFSHRFFSSLSHKKIRRGFTLLIANQIFNPRWMYLSNTKLDCKRC